MQDKSNDDAPVFEENQEALAEQLAANLAENAETQPAEETMTISVAEYNKLKADLNEAKDRSLRALAELENFRNRTNRLQKEERKYASADIARAILPLWDNLGLALSIQDPEKNVLAFVDGVKMVYQEFLNVLEKNGVKKIQALGQPFDPKFHESVAFVPSDEYPANTVAVELKAGFMLHDRVIRAAQVCLAAPVQKQQEGSKAE